MIAIIFNILIITHRRCNSGLEIKFYLLYLRLLESLFYFHNSL